MPVRPRSRSSSSERNSRLQLAQLVELLVVAVGDHAAVAHHRRRFLQDCAAQQRQAFGRRLQIVSYPRQQWRVPWNRARELGQQSEAVPQGRQVARPRVAERDAAGNALDIGEPPQELVNTGVSLGERGNRFVARGERLAIAQGMVKPMPEQAAPHAGCALVEQ